jgi:YVTN family beta-propeller protein
VAVTADGTRILTADRDSDQISIVDATTLARTGSVPVGKRPFGVTVDAEGRRAYTANVASDDVSVIDLAAGKVVGTVKVGHRPYAVALSGDRAFVTNQYGGTVTVFDASTLAVLETIEVGEYPEGIEADPAGGAVYVACWDANTLERIDTAKLEVVSRIPVGNGPRAFGRFLRTAN